MTSQTPKTDANLLFLDCDDSCLDIYVKTKDGKKVTGGIVSADLARELELELKDVLSDTTYYIRKSQLEELELENAAMREAINSAFDLRELLDRCSIDECPPDFTETLRVIDAKLQPFLK